MCHRRLLWTNQHPLYGFPRHRWTPGQICEKGKIFYLPRLVPEWGPAGGDAWKSDRSKILICLGAHEQQFIAPPVNYQFWSQPKAVPCSQTCIILGGPTYPKTLAHISQFMLHFIQMFGVTLPRGNSIGKNFVPCAVGSQAHNGECG